MLWTTTDNHAMVRTIRHSASWCFLPIPTFRPALSNQAPAFSSQLPLRKATDMSKQIERDGPTNELEILQTEVTPSMRIEGACVLEGWLAGDPEYVGLEALHLVGMIYSRMRLSHS